MMAHKYPVAYGSMTLVAIVVVALATSSMLIHSTRAWGTFNADRASLAAASDTKYIYGLMLDAGSSGTRIHVYVWPKRTNASLPGVETAPIGEVPYSMKIQPGISSFESDPSQAGASLIPLLDVWVWGP
jgi:hypothetical protein